MPGDLSAFGTYFPQGGDSLHQTLQRLLAQSVRPAESEVIYLASAARLGSTAGAIIDTRGFKGIMVNCYVTGVAGVGTLRLTVNSSTNILMPSAVTLVAQTAFGTISQGVVVYPGVSTPIATGYTLQGFPLGRFTQITFQNSSAVGGNEVTAEVSYILIP